MTKRLFALLIVLAFGQSAYARIISHEITPANFEQKGWRIKVQIQGDEARFTVFHNAKDGKLKAGTTASLVVRNGDKSVCRAVLGLTMEDGKTCFSFSVARDQLKDSQFHLLVIDVPIPSGDDYWFSLQKFHDAQPKEPRTK
jgi:hypothetical protein